MFLSRVSPFLRIGAGAEGKREPVPSRRDGPNESEGNTQRGHSEEYAKSEGRSTRPLTRRGETSGGIAPPL